jgi:hypothetical protein
VFQGRYKAVVINGEGREGCYFRIVADYIHLNPVRAGLVGGDTGKRLGLEVEQFSELQKEQASGVA